MIATLKKIRWQVLCGIRDRRMDLTSMRREYLKRFEPVVRHGPFAGMRAYITESAGSMLIPKLLGSYESELHEVIHEAIKRNPPQVTDIGAAEGYYAVGLARALPVATINTYEIERTARDLCGELARLNRVEDRVRCLSKCEPMNLSQMPPQTLVVCDCEGGEVILLDPERSPALRTADVLVELHEAQEPGVTKLIASRFESSHNIQVIRQVEKDPADYPEIQTL